MGMRNIPVDVNRFVNEVADDSHSVIQGCPLQGVVSHLIWLIQQAGIRLCCFPQVFIVPVCTGCAHTLHWWCGAWAARSAAGKLRLHVV